MAEERKQNEMNKALFTSLVMMLSSSVMQQLGKLVNPITNKTEVNLEGAQVTIDMLAMLQEKTKGNLDKDEEKILNDILSSLQMNYVDTSRSITSADSSTEASAKSEAPAQEKEAEKESGGKQTPAEKKDDEKKRPKFRKSYGG